MCKPGDGLRCIYLPKDMQDFSYYPCGFPAADAADTTCAARNNGIRNSSDTLIMNGVKQNATTNISYRGLDSTIWPNI